MADLAAKKKSERLRLEEEYHTKRDKWESEHQLDEVVDVDEEMNKIVFHTSEPVKKESRQHAEA
jgi:ATP-dependent Clp protease ATP-binding subunit ClpC